jgi:hypothetical protein
MSGSPPARAPRPHPVPTLTRPAPPSPPLCPARPVCPSGQFRWGVNFPGPIAIPLNALTGFSRAPNIRLMTKRVVRIVKHVGSVPCVAACAACGEQFTAPLSALRRVKESRTRKRICKDSSTGTNSNERDSEWPPMVKGPIQVSHAASTEGSGSGSACARPYRKSLVR